MFGQEKRLRRELDHMEMRVEELQQCITELVARRESLEDINSKLTTENKRLRQKRQMEDEMIAHKLKMREEQVEMSADKRIALAEQEAAKETQKAIANVKDEYRDKLENQLVQRGDELKDMYTEILARLPNVNMALTGNVSGMKPAKPKAK